ncbi:MAG TPA: hypothetical protein VLB90_00940 [Pseudomonadales bacterium]|nr:hypothetical protein [Pseudomonadales bacterium]
MWTPAGKLSLTGQEICKIAAIYGQRENSYLIGVVFCSKKQYQAEVCAKSERRLLQ